jgi:hypothetical protein
MFARKLVTSATLMAGILLSIPVNAQGWDGFYVDGAIGARNSSSTTTFTDTSTTSYTYYPGYTYTSGASNTDKQDLGATNLLGEFSAGWRWAGPVVVGIGVFADAAGSNAGKSSSSSTYAYFSPYGYSSSVYTDTTELKQNSRYGISVDVAPNWRTHPYAKVSYAWSRYEVSSNGSPDCNGRSGSSSETLSGWGFGGGVRHLQTDNLYFFAEVMWQNYGSKTQNVSLACGSQSYYQNTVQSQTLKIDPSNVVGVVGMGWKF